MKNQNINIDRTIILKRVNLIKLAIKKLITFQALSPGKFMKDDNFAIAEHYLRYALEATFDICSHILSRIDGADISTYKQMALEMGRQQIVPIEFAQDQLEKMAGYRNRLTHFYFEVTPQEMYNIIQNNLGDFEVFLKEIKKLLK